MKSDLNENKLIGMCDYIDQIILADASNDGILIMICEYKNFLSSPLDLGQFVPCVDGKPLPMPSGWGTNNPNHPMPEPDDIHNSQEYTEAEKRVIFTGITVRHDTFKSLKRTFIEFGKVRIHTRIEFSAGNIEDTFTLKGHTIEHFTNFILTDKKAIELGLKPQ